MKTADHYVKIYCDCLLADHLNSEIAWEGPHTLGTLMDHLGEMPCGSGFFHDVLSERVDKMRSLHPDFSRSVELMELVTIDQYQAMFAWEAAMNKKPEHCNRYLRTGKDVVAYLIRYCKCFEGRNYDWFQKTRRRGLDRINAELEVLIA